MSFEIIAVIISLSIDIYIHYETDIFPFTHSLKSVSLNKSVVYYTTHSPQLSNQLDIVDIFSLSFVLLVCNGKEVSRYVTEVYNCLRIFSFWSIYVVVISFHHILS